MTLAQFYFERAEGNTRVSCNYCETSIVKQPWMREETWKAIIHDFVCEHNCGIDTNE